MNSSTFSDWDLYRFAIWTGLRTLPVSPREGLKRVVLPIEYVRCAENRYVLTHLDATTEHSVLDIGSPKLLSLFLAARVGAQVHATDLIDYFFEAYRAHARAVGADDGRYLMETQDARRLNHPDASFDRVFSISAIEHIPDDGDAVSMKEIARVLKPGGICCLTVPWNDGGYHEVFKRKGDPDAYWVQAAGEYVFFQREYDHDSLRRRLLEGADLEALDVSFFGEAKVPVEHVILNRRLPKAVRWGLFPAHFPLSRMFLRPLTEDQPSKKKVAALTLRKRRGPARSALEDAPCAASSAS